MQRSFFVFLGSLPGGKNFSRPPNRPPSLLFDQSLSPNWVLSLKISKILPNFSLNFDYFLAQNCIRKLYFMLKTPKFALILLVGGILASANNISKSPIIDSVPDVSPPSIWLRPWWVLKIFPVTSPPTRNFGIVRSILIMLGGREGGGRAVCDPKRFWVSYMVIKYLICIIYSWSYEYLEYTCYQRTVRHILMILGGREGI